MTVSVDIEVARRADTLVAPADAVFDAASAHPWVLAIVGHRAAQKPVTLGLRGEGRVEILEGVARRRSADRRGRQRRYPGQRVRTVARHAGNASMNPLARSSNGSSRSASCARA